MQRLHSQREALQYLRDTRAPSDVVRAFGDLITEAERNYQTRGDGLFEGAQGSLRTTVTAPPFYNNYNTSFIAPFVTGQTSVQVLPANNRRTMVLIQNQSASSDLYFNLGGGAGPNSGILLPAGVGIVMDSVCPSDSINCYFDNVAPQQGAVLEIRFTT